MNWYTDTTAKGGGGFGIILYSRACFAIFCVDYADVQKSQMVDDHYVDLHVQHDP